MKLEFDIKITAKELYDFMLYHTYTGFSGLFGSGIGYYFLYSMLTIYESQKAGVNE